MKTIIDGERVFKATLSADGNLVVNILNGKTFNVQLNPNELTQVLFRIAEGSQGLLAFDPQPMDIVGMHENDVKTLEAQSLVIEELREKLREAHEAAERHDATITELNEANYQLSNIRNQLQETMQVVEKQAEQLRALTVVTLDSTANAAESKQTESKEEPESEESESEESKPETVEAVEESEQV